MSIIERFKRDIARHRGRAAVLGVLAVTFAVFMVKGVVDLKRGPAMPVPTANGKPAEAVRPTLNSAESEARVNESRKLWRQLREVKSTAASAAVAFAFDSSLYPAPLPDPTRRVAAAPVPEAEPLRVGPTPEQALLASREKAIREQARQLVVKTIAIGNDTTPSMAIVNSQLMVVGQSINGFELTAIRPRECEFVKETVTSVIPMANGQ
jgi:hypothetical protein